VVDPAAIQHLVARALAASPDIPEDAHGAFLTVANQESLKAVIAVRLHGDWTVQSVVEHAWGSKTVAVGVVISGTF
jgi:hypothetical protein